MGMFGGMQMNKTRLIDILNMIAKGELEEGTKIKHNDIVLSYEKSCLMTEFGGKVRAIGFGVDELNGEVEIIGKETKTATKIEELDWREINNGRGFEVETLDKLNEVIRELNRRGE